MLEGNSSYPIEKLANWASVGGGWSYSKVRCSALGGLEDAVWVLDLRSHSDSGCIHWAVLVASGLEGWARLDRNSSGSVADSLTSYDGRARSDLLELASLRVSDRGERTLMAGMAKPFSCAYLKSCIVSTRALPRITAADASTLRTSSPVMTTRRSISN